MEKNTLETPGNNAESNSMNAEQEPAEDFIAKNFHNYLDDLGLSEVDLKNKRVLDTGAGARTFAGHCVRTGINRDVYSLEPRIGETYPEEEKELAAILNEKQRKEIDSKTVKAVMERMPLKDQSMDLVLAENAMPGFDSEKGEKMQASVENSFNEIIRVLKPGGEARLYPLYMNEYEEFRKPLVEEINKKIEELKKDKNLEILIQEVRRLPSSLASDAIQETFGRIVIKKINNQEEKMESRKKQSRAEDQIRIEELRKKHGFESSSAEEEYLEREIAEKVENYPHLDLQEKVELLLILGGYKKANEQDFESDEWYDGQSPKNVAEEKIKSYEKLLNEIGLVFEKKREQTKGRVAHKEDNYEYVRNIERMRYIFAKKREDLERYKKAEQEQSDELYGDIYGFPKTSIDAFKKPSGIIEYNELPDEVRKDESYGFLTFKLSRENYRTEFETAKKWAEFVKGNSPKIYQKYLEYMSKVEGR